VAPPPTAVVPSGARGPGAATLQHQPEGSGPAAGIITDPDRMLLLPGESRFLSYRTADVRGGAAERLPLRTVSTLGRDAGNDVVVNDDAASARHAIVELADGVWWIEDQRSTNGTLLNGARIGRRERIRDGDVVDIGRVSLRFESVA